RCWVPDRWPGAPVMPPRQRARTPPPVPAARSPRIDPPPRDLDQPPGDRKTEAEPAMASRAARVGLAEAFEHVRQELGRDPLAVVFHHDHDLVADALATHRDPAARGRELERIRPEVSAPLPPRVPVADR